MPVCGVSLPLTLYCSGSVGLTPLLSMYLFAIASLPSKAFTTASRTCSCVVLSNSWLGCCAYLLTPPSAGSACINFNSCVSEINSAARSRRTVSIYSWLNFSTGTSRLSDNRTLTASSSVFGISGFVALFKSFNISVLEFTLFSNSVYRGSDALFFNSFMIVSFAFCGKSSSAFRKLSFGASSSYLN